MRPSHSLPQEPSAASRTLRACQKVPKELGYLRNGYTQPPRVQTEVPRAWDGVYKGLEWLARSRCGAGVVAQGLGLGFSGCGTGSQKPCHEVLKRLRPLSSRYEDAQGLGVEVTMED